MSSVDAGEMGTFTLKRLLAVVVHLIVHDALIETGVHDFFDTSNFALYTPLVNWLSPSLRLRLKPRDEDGGNKMRYFVRFLYPQEVLLPLLGQVAKKKPAVLSAVWSAACGRTTMPEAPLLPSTCRELCKCRVVSAAPP